MADDVKYEISKIKVNGHDYDIVDAQARATGGISAYVNSLGDGSALGELEIIPNNSDKNEQAADMIMQLNLQNGNTAGSIVLCSNGQTTLQTGAPNQFVIGTYNQASDKSLFIIGAGQSDDSRQNVFNVDSDGAIYGNNFFGESFNALYATTTSDRRLKENIEEYTCKNSILDLPVYSYNYIKDGHHTIGCMAQDLQKICPDIVNESHDGYLNIEESKLVYLLLAEIKKLNKRVSELENKK